MTSVDQCIYLDYNASSPLDPRVLETMMPFLQDEFGNPASTHSYGSRAKQAVEHARDQVARLLGTSPWNIIFTSGATESNNLAIKGIALASQHKGRHIVTSLSEHSSVLGSCKALQESGFQITWLRPDMLGRISVESLREVVTDHTVLVSLMAANNEIGTLYPVGEYAKVCRDRGIPFHCDATQAIGRIPIDVEDWATDLITLSAHKICGPKGTGILYRHSAALVPQIRGGWQESGWRSGTLNVPGIVGLGSAAQILQDEGIEETEKLYRLRDSFEAKVADALGNVVVNGDRQGRLCNTSNLYFPGILAEELVQKLPNLAFSIASACMTRSQTGSHVLRALGFQEDRVRGSARFSIGRFTTAQDIDCAVEAVVKAAKSLQRTRFDSLHG